VDGGGRLIGVVAAEVAAAAFAAIEGGLGDEEADTAHAAEFVIETGGLFAGFERHGPEHADSGLEALFIAADTAVLPGDGAEVGFRHGGEDFGAGNLALGGAGGEAGHGGGGTGAEDDAFQQGVAGEAVGAVDTGAGDFAGGKEARDGGEAVEIGMDAAHGVVGGGMDGGGLFGEIEAVVEAGLEDAGEVVLHDAGGEVGHVEKHVGGAGAGDFRDNGAADDVAGGEFVGEALAGGVAEEGAVTAEGFREEESGGAIEVEGGGVELDEFDIADDGAGAPGHGDAIAGGDIGVGGVLVDAAEAAGGEQDGVGEDGVAFAVAGVVGDGAADLAILHEQIGNGGEAEEADVGKGGGFPIEGAGDFTAGGIAVGMEDAVAGVGAFAAEDEDAAFPIELGAPFEEFLDDAGAFGDEGADGVRVAETIAGGEGILLVEGDLVIVGKGGGDASLRILGGRLMEGVLGEDEHLAVFGKGNGGPQAGDASPDHQKVTNNAVRRSTHTPMVQTNQDMPSHVVTTGTQRYECHIERGILSRIGEFLPAKAGKVFVVTTRDVWQLHGAHLTFPHEVIFFPGGEPNKRLPVVEAMAEEMVAKGADRSSVVVAFGGGIVGDTGGFLAAMFMRGIPVIQVPTTLLAQVDAAIGGKTGVNLASGKNLAGAFHQPLAVVIDPAALRTLPPREYRAGLFEVVKYGIISSPALFELLAEKPAAVLAQDPEAVDFIVSDSVRIKAEVVSADEKEGGLRRILNYGHTLGHALEAETRYERLLHGEAVGYGMNAASYLAERLGLLDAAVGAEMRRVTNLYGPWPAVNDLSAEVLAGHTLKDKKTIQGTTHFVLAEGIGKVRVVSGIAAADVVAAAAAAL
jgi:3-dehydroquinate synthase